MRKEELKVFNDCTLSEINAAIEERFQMWDRIYCYGSDGNNLSDGCLLNNMRNDIRQLREKREKRFPSSLAGQLCFDGTEEQEERPLPVELPFNWQSPGTETKKRQRILETMQSILGGE